MFYLFAGYLNKEDHYVLSVRGISQQRRSLCFICSQDISTKKIIMFYLYVGYLKGNGFEWISQRIRLWTDILWSRPNKLLIIFCF